MKENIKIPNIRNDMSTKPGPGCMVFLLLITTLFVIGSCSGQDTSYYKTEIPLFGSHLQKLLSHLRLEPRLFQVYGLRVWNQET